MAKETLRRVEVEWLDSATQMQWLPLTHYLDPRRIGPLPCTSVGYLMRHDDEAVVVVQSLAENDSAADSISIPTACVQKIRRLYTRAEVK